MTYSRSLRTALAIGIVVFLGVLSTTVGAAGAASPAGAGHVEIDGTGSTWAANAVNQWVADVTSQGLQVNFTGTGSAQGRSDFANNITDFGVTDIGYQGTDPGTGTLDSNCVPGQGCRQFAYEPIVAGGTSFPYHIIVAGKQVRDLRLSGETIAKIFTYQITNWDDPEITKDNNGHALPSLQIVPVVHSEGAGSTAQFTTYLNTEFPSIWQSFSHLKSFVEYYPAPTSSEAGVAENGSDGVMNFVASAAANGAIGYDEYSYPLAKNYPVAQLLNKAGYYVLPTQYNVAVALQHAQINMDKSSPDYLLQTLTNVYTAPEPQAYPLSSYSYFLIPTGANDKRMTSKKRQTLADFLYYAVCQGQKEMGPIGYSPLPSVLVQASFAQTTLLGKVDPNVNVSKEESTTLASCDNPTFYPGNLQKNKLAVIAPLPPACDKVGEGPCDLVGGGSGATSNSNPGKSGTVTTTTSGGTSTPGGGSSTGPAGTSSIGPLSTTTGGGGGGGGGLTTGLGGGGGTTGNGGSASGVANPTNLAGYRSPNLTGVLGPLAVVLLLLVLIAPAAIYYFVLAPRRKATGL